MTTPLLIVQFNRRFTRHYISAEARLLTKRPPQIEAAFLLIGYLILSGEP